MELAMTDLFFGLMILMLFLLVVSLFYFKVLKRTRNGGDENKEEEMEKEEYGTSINIADSNMYLLSRAMGYLFGLCGVSQTGVQLSLSRGFQIRVIISKPRMNGQLITRLNSLIRPYCPLHIAGIAADRISIALSPGDIWNCAVPEITACSLVISAKLERPCDWSIDRGLAYAADVKHAMADYLTDIVNGSRSLVPRTSWSAKALDTLISYLRGKIIWFEIRIYDEEANFTFGLISESFDMSPGVPSDDTMMNIPRNIRASSCAAYLNPSVDYAPDAGQSSKGRNVEVLLSCSLLQWELEFPATWGTSMQPGVMPMGRGKRIRLRSQFYHPVVNIHPDQLRVFLFSTLKSTGLYEYYSFLRHFIDLDNVIRRTYASESEEQEYQVQYLNMLKAQTRAEKQKYILIIRKLEVPLTLSGIMRLRRRIFKWKFPKPDSSNNVFPTPGVTEPPVLCFPTPSPETGAEEGEEQGDAAMAAFLRRVKPWWDDVLRPIREVSVHIDVSGLIITIFDDEASGHTTRHSYGGSEFAVLSGLRAHASLTVLVGPDDAGVMCGAAPQSTREPDVKWIDVTGDIVSPTIEMCNISKDRLLFSHSSSDCESCLKWSVQINGQRRGFYKLSLFHSTIDLSHSALWRRLSAIVAKATTRPIEPSMEELYPMQNVVAVASLEGVHVNVERANIIERRETIPKCGDYFILAGWNGEFRVSLSNVDLFFQLSVAHSALSMNISSSISVSSWLNHLENISVDASRLAIHLHHLSCSSHASEVNDKVGILSAQGIFFQSVNLRRTFSETHIHRAGLLCAMRDGFNGHYVTRCVVKFDYLDAYRDLSQNIFDNSTQRPSVMLQARLRGAVQEGDEKSEAPQSVQVFLDSSDRGPGSLEFFVAHSSIRDEVVLELDMFLLVETIQGGNKTLIGTASGRFPIQRFVEAKREEDETLPPSLHVTVPITRAIGLSPSLRPLKVTATYYHALLSTSINSLRLISFSEDLNTDGGASFAYVRISTKNRILSRSSCHYSDLNTDRKTMNSCFFLKPSLPGENNDQLLTKRTRSKQIVDLQQDIEYNEKILLPCAMNSEAIFLNFELVLEKRFSEHVLASTVIEGASAAEIFDKTMSITLRDRDGFSIALIMGKIGWSAEFLHSGGIKEADRKRLDLSLDGGIQTLRHDTMEAPSNSIWAINPHFESTSGDLSNRVECRDREISFCVRSIELNLSKAIIARIASFGNKFTDASGIRNYSSDRLVEAIPSTDEKDHQSHLLRLPHKGELVALLGELDASEIRDIILGDFASIPEMIVFSSAAYYPIDFWQHFCAATACTDRKIYLPGYERGQDRWMESGLLSEIVKVIQTRMVLGFRNYQLAEASWRYIVAPAWIGLPRIGGFRLAAGAVPMKYRPMSCPLIAGDRTCRVYVDSDVTIRTIPAEFRTLPLGGIMTVSSDRILSGSKVFEFEVADSCTLLFCFDSRVKSYPDWISKCGFIKSDLTIFTSAGSYAIFIKHVHLEEEELTCEISLGGCGLYRLSDGDNYFLLYTSLITSIGAPDSAQYHSKESVHHPPLAGCAAADCRWAIRPNAPVPTSQKAHDDYSDTNDSSKLQLSFSQDESIQPSSGHVNTFGTETVGKDCIVSRSYLFANLSAIKITFAHEAVAGRSSSLDLVVNALELDCRMRHKEELFDLSSIDEVRAGATLEVSLMLRHRALGDNLFAAKDHSRQILLPLRARSMILKDPFALKLSTTIASLNPAVIECPPELIPLCIDISSSLMCLNQNSLTQSSGSLIADLPQVSDSLVFSEITSTKFESWCLNNELGVDISVRVESNIDICAVTDTVCLQIGKGSDRAIMIKAGQSISFYLMRRTCFEFDILKDTKFVLSIEGWQVDAAITFDSFGRKLHRIALDEDDRRSNLPGQFRASESSCSGESGMGEADKDGSYGSSEEESVIETDSRGDVGDGFSSSEDSESVCSLTWKSVSGDEVGSDVDDEDLGSVHLAPDSGNVEEAESFKTSAARQLRKRSKIAPFAIESIVEQTPSSNRESNKFELTLRSNVCVANDSSCTLRINFLSDRANTSLLELARGQRSNVPLYCLHQSKFSFGFRPHLKDVSFAEDKESMLRTVALSPASFDAKVPRALRTPKELENNSIKVQMSAQSEESFQEISKNARRDSFIATWDLVFYSPCKIINALPCDVRFQVVQPGSSDASSKTEGCISPSKTQKRQASSLATSELFFLPSEFYTKSTGGSFDVDAQSHEYDNGVQFFCGNNQSNEYVIADETVQPGKILELSNLDTSKNLYFRLAIPGTDLWTQPACITSGLLQRRALFSRHTSQDLLWDFNRYQDILLVTPPEIRYKREWEVSRTIVLFSQFWILNKTGVSLLYDPVPNVKQVKKTKSRSLNAPDNPDDDEPKKLRNSKSINRSHDKTAMEFRPEKRRFLSDVGHMQFFGNSSIPILLSSKKRRLRLLTLSLGDSAVPRHQEELYVYDLQTTSPSSFRYVETYGWNSISQVYSDVRDMEFISWPKSMIDSEAIIHIRTADSDKLSDPNDENMINFRMSINADVCVCIDARLSKALRWMSVLGFRATGDKLKTSSPRHVFAVYKKFYKGHSLVSLGGNKASTGFKSPANMFLVFVMKPPPSMTQYSEPTIDGKVYFSPRAISKISSALGSEAIPCKIICRVQIGETVFSDEDTPLHSWPNMFNSISILCIQTANGDKRLKSQSYLRFSLQQPSRVMLCIDSTIKYHELPSWVAEHGFSPISLTVSAGSATFYLYQQLFGAEVVHLGGLAYSGSSKISNYFVLVADEFQFQNAWNLMSMSSAVVSPGQPQAMVGVRATESDSVPGLIESMRMPSAISDAHDNIRNMSRPITSFWDDSVAVATGKCSLEALPVDLVERYWSNKHIDLKSGNKGEIVAGNCTYSVRVDYLPGVFFRTSLLTLMPRFVISNQSALDLRVFPFSVDASSAPRSLRNYAGWTGFEQRCRVVKKGESAAVIAFHDANGPGGYFVRINRNNSEYESRERKRWLYFFSQFDSSLAESAPERGYDYQSVSPDSVGEQFTFVQLFERHIGDVNRLCPLVALSITVVLVDQCVVLTVRDITHSPPVRLENHLAGVTLKFRQAGAEEWVLLGPRSWKNYVWSNNSLAKNFEFLIENYQSRTFMCSAEKIEDVSNFIIPGYVLKVENSNQASNSENRIMRIHVTTDDLTRVLRITDSGIVSALSNRPLRRFGDVSSFVHPSISAGIARSKKPRVQSRETSASFALRSFRKARQYISRNSRWIKLSNFFFVEIQLKIMAVLIKVVESNDKSRLESANSSDSDLIDVSIEGICLTLDGSKYLARLSVMHVQLDDMHRDARFPVVISPSNSGFNSHLSLERLRTAVPVLQFVFEIEPNTMHLVNIKTLDVVLQPLRASLDGALLFRTLKYWGQAIRFSMLQNVRNLSDSTIKPSSFMSSADTEQFVLDSSVRAVMDKLYFTLNDLVQKCCSSAHGEVVYIEVMHVSSIVLNLELFMDHGRYVRSRGGEGGSSSIYSVTGAVASDDPSAAMGLAGLDARIASVLSVVGAAVRSIGHVSPQLSFNEILVTNFFGNRQLLRRFFVASYKREAFMQSYKILGSMEILGDPLSLAHNLGAGVVQLFRQTRAEVIGDSSTRGEGLKRLARAIVGGTAGSASKIAGSLAELLSALAGVDIAAALDAEEGAHTFEESEPEEKHLVSLMSTPEGIDEFAPLETSGYRDRHILSNSVKRGSAVVVNSLVEGISSLAFEPVRGLQSGGVLGAAKGVARGIFKAVATPMAGALGAVSVMTKSVERKARFGGKVPVGRRRPHLVGEPGTEAVSSNSSLEGGAVARRLDYDWMEPQYSDKRSLPLYRGANDEDDDGHEVEEEESRPRSSAGESAVGNRDLVPEALMPSAAPGEPAVTLGAPAADANSGRHVLSGGGGVSRPIGSRYFAGADFIGMAL